MNTETYARKRVLVTGGTGSIGSHVVRQLLHAGADVVRVLSRDETRQMEFQEQLSRDWDLRRLRFLIGDVRDPIRLRRAMEGVDLVFHAAAMKHVPACEYNPFEAVQTNVLGTQNVITSAREAKVRRVVAISTDKATSPENTMGATKLLAERLVSSAQLSAAGQVLSAVRFGNVIGSRGSLVPRVLRQLEDERRAYITHPEMTRFMMTIHDAVALVLEGGARAGGGEIFVLRMPSLRVRDLLEVVVEEHARRSGRRRSEYTIDEVGIRPGEKLHETLLTVDESRRARAVRDDLLVVDPPSRVGGPDDDEGEGVDLVLDSAKGPFLSEDEILDLLVRSDVFSTWRDNVSAPTAFSPSAPDSFEQLTL